MFENVLKYWILPKRKKYQPKFATNIFIIFMHMWQKVEIRLQIWVKLRNSLVKFLHSSVRYRLKLAVAKLSFGSRGMRGNLRRVRRGLRRSSNGGGWPKGVEGEPSRWRSLGCGPLMLRKRFLIHHALQSKENFLHSNFRICSTKE